MNQRGYNRYECLMCCWLGAQSIHAAIDFWSSALVTGSFGGSRRDLPGTYPILQLTDDPRFKLLSPCNRFEAGGSSYACG